MRNVFEELIESRAKDSRHSLYSVCSSNTLVLEATIRRAARTGLPVLVEATANQVNQNGGYTGLHPSDFAAQLDELCRRYGTERDLVIFGGDHLGPYPWRNLQADQAMEAAERLVREFVAAGAKKIHLDASMGLGGDDSPSPEAELVANRAVTLCAAAEDEYSRLKAHGEHFQPPPVYVIGTEVPVPGGAVGDGDFIQNGGSDFPHPTSSESLLETIDQHEKAFIEAGLGDAWRRVIAVVVQPGMEFGSGIVHPYKREKIAELKKTVAKRSSLFFEGHSTDYQSDGALRALVEDRFIFLKVGPALTFALREALIGLSYIEALVSGDGQNRIELALLRIMKSNDKYWKDYYPKDEKPLLLYSLSDRVRYYWDTPEMRLEIERLFSVLQNYDLMPGLISQYLPRFGGPHNIAILPRSITPRELALAAVDAELARYEIACHETKT